MIVSNLLRSSARLHWRFAAGTRLQLAPARRGGRTIMFAMAVLAPHMFTAAACDAGHEVENQLKLSAAGKLNIRPSAAPTDAQVSNGEWVTYVAHPDLHVPDGFNHTIVIDTKTHQAWVHEVGGFVWNGRWYGPFPATSSIQGCPADPWLKSMSAYLKR
jgi:hypothetical protein